MHKTFYASGFIYNVSSRQILLQKQVAHTSTASSEWVLFGSVHKESDKPDIVFKKIIKDRLHVKVDKVYPIYSYLSESTGISYFICYSKLKKIQTFSTKNGHGFEWFSFKDVLKLQIHEQTKHDIVVGQRVIEAEERKRLGLRTLQ